MHCAVGMVFLLDEWGMGEAHILNQQNVNQYNLGQSNDHDDDEISLLPLANQVRLSSYL